MDWYPWFPTAFRRDTYSLSLAEDGAYRRLIDEYMITRSPLPDDDRALARILGIGVEEWAQIAPAVRKFFRPSDGVLNHKRCACELRAQDMRSQRFSERGKKAAFAKYSKVNGVSPRRKLVPPTLQDKDISLTSSESVAAKESGQPTKGVSVELQAIMRRKLGHRG